MKIKNKCIMYIMLVLSASNGSMVLANEINSVIDCKQVKTEAQVDLLLAFIQKQTNFQARQTAIQAAVLGCGLFLMGLAVTIMFDLRAIKYRMRKG